MYETAALTSVQSNATGCVGVAPLAGLSNEGVPGVGGLLTVSVALRVVPMYVPEMVTLVFALTVAVVMVKLALVTPAGTVTLAGTAATAELPLVSATTTPPDGAAALRVTVPVEGLPPVTVLGLSERDDKVTLPPPPPATGSTAMNGCAGAREAG